MNAPNRPYNWGWSERHQPSGFQEAWDDLRKLGFPLGTIVRRQQDGFDRRIDVWLKDRPKRPEPFTEVSVIS